MQVLEGGDVIKLKDKSGMRDADRQRRLRHERQHGVGSDGNGSPAGQVLPRSRQPQLQTSSHQTRSDLVGSV